jgi:hypothetical protein
VAMEEANKVLFYRVSGSPTVCATTVLERKLFILCHLIIGLCHY